MARVLAHKSRSPFLFEKYKITSTPSTIFLDLEGKDAGALGDTSVFNVAKLMNETADKINRIPAWAENREKGLETGKSAAIPTILFFQDGKEKSLAVEAMFGEKPLAEILGSFVWIKVKFDPKSDEAKKLGIEKFPALLVVDPRLDDPMAKLLKKIDAPKASAGLKTELDAVLKDWKKE